MVLFLYAAGRTKEINLVSENDKAFLMKAFVSEFLSPKGGFPKKQMFFLSVLKDKKSCCMMLSFSGTMSKARQSISNENAPFPADGSMYESTESKKDSIKSTQVFATSGLV
jgi:hypothetical protein